MIADTESMGPQVIFIIKKGDAEMRAFIESVAKEVCNTNYQIIEEDND